MSLINGKGSSLFDSEPLLLDNQYIGFISILPGALAIYVERMLLPECTCSIKFQIKHLVSVFFTNQQHCISSFIYVFYNLLFKDAVILNIFF